MNAYNIDWWGNGYFSVNEKGHVTVNPTKSEQTSVNQVIDLSELVNERLEKGQKLPALFCFPQILQSRLHDINKAFKDARQEYGYSKDYFLVYPVKVNQHKRVLDALTNTSEPIGLEAGSKAELMAVLAHAGRTRSIIVCNGYKDREYIRLALDGLKMGHTVFLVIEKMSELKIVLEESQRVNVTPKLGVRARLASQGSGKWQSSGGERSKFGLDASQVLTLVETLKADNKLHWLELLHFHLGSQMSNIRDITKGVKESAKFYTELSKLGVNIKYFDVGGGLGVDYEGTRSQSDCSVDYSLKEYANNIIWTIGDECRANRLEEPTIITESGRTLTVYHAILIANAIGIERNEFNQPSLPDEGSCDALFRLFETWDEIEKDQNSRSLREWLHDSQYDLQEVHEGYAAGCVSLTQRAKAEQIYLCICNKIQSLLDPANKSHRAIIDELQERMADKIYLNFSLFQSLPDAWGINQIFPVMPIEDLDKPLTRRAVILDITCDSDGAIKQYLDDDDITSTMPFPEYEPHKPPLIGVFMVGAYQEILGNMHNLFGNTEALDVTIDNEGKVTVALSDEGSTVDDMLRYVLLDPSKLLHEFSAEVISNHNKLDEKTQRAFIEEFKAGLYGYTYLEEE
ncbi:biosynthetic arginine decarboxylase [Succinatimonas sp. CAG:777]|nr:biosynthetic arginine decarboxylase [Succinatimonas sp. CAG:777]